MKKLPWKEMLRTIPWKRLRALPWRTVYGAAATAVVLLFCAWLPGRFVAEAPVATDRPLPSAPAVKPVERMTDLELWTAYRAGELSSEIDKSDGEALETGAEIAAGISSRLTLDIGESRSSAGGEECLTVGDRLHLYHHWNQWTGDWSNWLETYVNTDTREVYYFYISSSCKKNFDRYIDALSPGFNAETAASLWGDTVGLGTPAVIWSGDPDDAAEAYYGDTGYFINAKYYYVTDNPTWVSTSKL
jgi:hypothetical protein